MKWLLAAVFGWLVSIVSAAESPTGLYQRENQYQVKAIGSPQQNDVAFAFGTGAFYRYDLFSAEAGDDDAVLEPANGIGRWLKISLGTTGEESSNTLFATNAVGTITNNTAPPTGKLLLSLSADQTNGSFQVATNGAAFFGVHTHPYLELHGYLDNETAWASIHDPFLGDPNWNEWLLYVKNSDTGAFGLMGGYAYEGKAKIYIENGTGDVTMDTTSTDSSISVNRGNTSVWAGVEDTNVGKIFIRLSGTKLVTLEPMSANTVTPHIFDTSVAHISGNVLAVKNNTTNVFTVGVIGEATLTPMTKAQRGTLTAASGMFVWQSDNTPGLRVYNGTHWVKYSESNDD